MLSLNISIFLGGICGVVWKAGYAIQYITSYWHQFLYFPFHQLHGRYLARKNYPHAQFCGCCALYPLLPAIGGGPHCAGDGFVAANACIAWNFATVDFKYFLLLFLIGMFKKAVISDNLAPYVDDFFVNSGQYNGVDGIVATFFYTVQIYCDFSGYTDMAIAIAGLLGYQLKPNFAQSLFCFQPDSILAAVAYELIVLVEDYLYIPLGSNRGGGMDANAQYFHYHATRWALAWCCPQIFVLWGGLHGVGIIACHQWQRLRRVSKNLRIIIP